MTHCPPEATLRLIGTEDVGEEWLWLVIEYVAGGTLKDRLTQPLPPRDAARLLEIAGRTSR